MDWATTIFINDTTWHFAFELILRSFVMFMLIIVFLRLTGKRGVRQLSIFEVAILLALGSISGDPMFDHEIPILHAVVVMTVVIMTYRLITLLMMKYQPFEDLIEGKSLYIVEHGMLVVEKIKQGKMSYDEFFAEMRQQNVEHLGQVRVALLETDGKLSLLYYPDDDVQYGLPLFPKAHRPCITIQPEQIYACIHCGQCQTLSNPHQACPRCQNRQWTVAINSKRLA